MDNITSPEQRARIKSHRRKTFWQVWVPFVFALILILTTAVFVVLLTFNPDMDAFHTKWSSISMVFLSLPMLLVALLVLIILAGLIYLVWSFHKIVPEYSSKTLDFLIQIRDYARMGSDKILKPFIAANTAVAAIKSIYKKK